MTNSYYRGTAAVVLVFDITQRDSFTNLPMWINDVENLTDEGTVCCLVGNKLDLGAQRTVTFSEAQSFAIAHNMTYFETSAKKGLNVEEVFVTLTNTIVKRIKNNELKLRNDRGDGIVVLKGSAGSSRAAAFEGDDSDSDEERPRKKSELDQKKEEGDCGC